ncbi:Carboxylesterase [Phaeosphaeria sp. MPI-PUGE-AT-0046c]|nr:Carboxylesterase [Phaeosphaeria sp. MPI-PUGE-AT-0046c]
MDTPNTQNAKNTFFYEHPTLGSMTGLISPETPDVVRFRAIPYAELNRRFGHSTLREGLDETSRDFTKQGCSCPHTFNMDGIHSGGPYPGQEPILQSEFESLVLDVNVPRLQLESLQKGVLEHVPIMTYIHGGAFVLGKIDAEHNTAFMVQHSLAISKPVIATAIQYRLGALGFMALPDGNKNLGLWDQRNALLWIQKFIDGFGGDKSRNTLFGESAGGFSICCHMLSHCPSSGPLFNRVIIMSGIMGPMFAPISEEEATKAFDYICEELSIEERGLFALGKIEYFDVKAVISASDSWFSKGNMWRPVNDSSFFREKVTWDNVSELLGRCEWVEDMIVGNTSFEGLANGDIVNALTPSIFHRILKSSLSDEAVQKVMKAYKVTLDMDQNLFLTSAMRWIGDTVFDAPIHAFTKHVSAKTEKNIYRYIFDIRNPFPNSPFYQQPHHWVDVYFIFRTLQFRYPYEYLKDISDRHAALWLDFASGGKPWKRFESGGEEIMVIADEREGWVEKNTSEYEKMSGVAFGRLDELWDAWKEKRGEAWLPLDLVALKQ